MFVIREEQKQRKNFNIILILPDWPSKKHKSKWDWWDKWLFLL